MTSQNRTGTLSIESRNIFTILKKWLYTEQGTVFRELISNAADAITKRKQLIAAGQAQAYDEGSGRIDVVLDARNATLQIIDDGLGMTADEVERYINQIAFSSASEFLAGLDAEAGSPIIGHFGVGFYSAFMIADRVRLDTRSWQPEATPVSWNCDQQMAFTMGDGELSRIGTTVTLELTPTSGYLADPQTAAAAITRHFAFLATPIHYTFIDAGGSTLREAELLNDPDPVWKRPPDQVSPDELKTFYREHFNDQFDPLFWMRVSSEDIGLRGIIFFRNTRGGAEELDGRIDVLSRGVHIESNNRTLIPKFVNLQSGIIECDDLTLVVSRSTVRTDGEEAIGAELVFECLAQEMAIQMHDMFTNHRTDYERYWPEIGPFVKYGCLTDKIFASVMMNRLIFADGQQRYFTIREYLSLIEPVRPNTIFYASEPAEQAYYLNLYHQCQIPVLLLDHVIDQPLMRRIEMTSRGVAFMRLDADLAGVLQIEMDEEQQALAAAITQRFATVLGDRLAGMPITAVALRAEQVSVLIVADEASRRVGDLMQIYGLASGLVQQPDMVRRSLLINVTNPLVRLVALSETSRADVAIHHLVDLAQLHHAEPDPAMLPDFLARSETLLTAYLD